MYLARVQRAPKAAIEVAALVTAIGDGAAQEQLISLAELEETVADPIGLIARYGAGHLAERIADLDARGAPRLRAADLIFAPPVLHCSKICCLALNYADHAAESGLALPPEPVLFFKPPSALAGHGSAVVAPPRTRHVEHEVELAVVIGATVRDLPADQWRSAVAGFTIINDVTARDLQLAQIDRNEPWDRAKCFDTFAPVGPYLVTPDEIPDPQNLALTLTIDGEIRQQANTRDMVFTIPRLIADLSAGMTLEPGDIIATGTTAGIAPVRDGDVMQAAIEGLGCLVNPFLAAPVAAVR